MISSDLHHQHAYSLTPEHIELLSEQIPDSALWDFVAWFEYIKFWETMAKLLFEGSVRIVNHVGAPDDWEWKLTREGEERLAREFGSGE